jgi:hypothetical protein
LRDYLISNLPHARIEDESDLHRLLFDYDGKYTRASNDISILDTYEIGTNDAVYIKTCLEMPLEQVPLHLNFEYPLVPLVLNFRLKVGK